MKHTPWRSLLFALLLSAALTASAQSDKAEKLFGEAELYYKAARFDKAADLYTEAFVASQIPDLLFNVAQCYRNLKKYEDTLKILKQYMLLVSESDESLAESVPGLNRIKSLLLDIVSETDFPKKNASVKKLVKENEKLVDTLLSRVALLPKPSALSITGTTGATVFLDDIKLEGQTPLDILKAKKGSHKLSIKKDGYFSWAKSFEVSGDGKAISFLVELAPIVLAVDGTPEADVFLNGELKGKIPFRIEGIKEGAYKVSVRLSGHQEWSGDVILPGKTQDPISLKAELTPIVLRVDGPAGADLSLDGDLQGKLPLTIEKIAAGKHKLTVKQEGFEEWSTDITISNDKVSYEQKVELKPAKVAKIPKGSVGGPTDKVEGKSGAAFALYGTSAVALGGGVIALVGSMKAKNGAIALLNANQPSLLDLVDALDNQSRQLGVASIGAFAIAAGAGVGGFMLSQKSNKKTSLLLTPTGVALSGSF